MACPRRQLQQVVKEKLRKCCVSQPYLKLTFSTAKRRLARMRMPHKASHCLLNIFATWMAKSVPLQALPMVSDVRHAASELSSPRDEANPRATAWRAAAGW